MTDETAASTEHPSLKERAVGELKSFLYITLYFWVLFLVFNVYRMSFRAEGISIVDNGFAIVNALVLAKVALVTESLYKRRQARNVPLAYRVLSHSLLLTVVLIAFSLLEEAIKALVHGEGLGANFGAPQITYILGKAAIFFVLLIPFCAFQEVAQLVGGRALVEMFFSPPAGHRYALVRETEVPGGPA